MPEPSVRQAVIALLPQLRRYALALTRHNHDADDLVQSAVVRVLDRSLQPETLERLDGWMYTTIRNLWVDEVRRRKVRGISDGLDEVNELQGEDGRDVTEQRSELMSIKRVFDNLSTELRSAAVLVIVNGFTYQEAADTLGVPIGTIMSRVARARRAMLDARDGKTDE